jgi:hypothetical protein
MRLRRIGQAIAGAALDVRSLSGRDVAAVAFGAVVSGGL